MKWPESGIGVVDLSPQIARVAHMSDHRNTCKVEARFAFRYVY
jgi:hypothetical protein